MTCYEVNMKVKAEVTGFFDKATSTVSYVIKDPDSESCAVVDSVMDIDYSAGRITYDHADNMIAFIEDNSLKLEWLIETHVHADHLSAAPYIQQKLGGKIGIGAKITVVQETFGKIFNEGTRFQRDGSQFDALFEDGERYQIGGLSAVAMATPGHTPACMAHVIGDAAFVGDTVFMPDSGSARADFPGGDAGQLYDSIQRILALPDDMRLFMCHDYSPNGRKVQWETTVAEQKAHNIHVCCGRTRDQFVTLREARDEQLDVPKLILPSLQVNMRAGALPRDLEGNAALTIPLNSI